MSKILKTLSTSVFFVYICTIAVLAEAFLPPRWIETNICLYRVEYNENGDAADAKLIAEKTLSHLLRRTGNQMATPANEGGLQKQSS